LLALVASLQECPRNPLLFSILYRMNAVEHIGSGINRIHSACKDYGIKAPIVQVEENWVTLIFLRPPTKKDWSVQDTMQDTMQATEQDTMQAAREKEILSFCQMPKSREEIQNYIKIKNRDYFRKEILNPLIQKDLLKMTIPEKPNSPKQKYYSSKMENR